MLIRFVRDSVGRAPRRKALMIAAIAMGSAVATSMLGVMLSIGDKINRELRAVGANIVVTPRAASVTGGVGGVTAAAAGGENYLAAADVLKIKSIFWGLNITGFAPSLMAQDGPVAVQGVWFRHPYKTPAGVADTTGIRDVTPAWQLVKGEWPEEIPSRQPPGCVVGEGLARQMHWNYKDTIRVLGANCRVAAILSTGEEADDRVLMPLERLQQLTHREGLIDRIDVAALTKPEDDFARRDPKTMTPSEFERWNCTNYVISIAHEIEQAIPGAQARPVRRVSDSEGKILDKVSGLMGLITLAALLSAALTVWSLTAATMMERRGEIAIMQAMGAGRSIVAALLGLEIALVGIVGGAIGALAGVFLAKFVGRSVFQDAVQVSWVLPLVIVAAAALVALAGAAQPLRRALRFDPAVILREGV